MTTTTVKFKKFEIYVYKGKKYLQAVYVDKDGNRYYQTIKEMKRIRKETK